MDNEENRGSSRREGAAGGGEAKSAAMGPGADSIVKKYEKLAESDPGSPALSEASFTPGETIGMEDDILSLKKENMRALFRENGKALAGVLVVVVLIAGALAFRQPTEKPDADLLNNVVTPENSDNVIIKSSLEKMKRVKAFHYDGKINVVSRGHGTESVSALTHDGVAQFDGDTPEFYASFAFEQDRADKAGNLKSRGDVEAAYLDKTFYAKVNDFTYSEGSIEGMEEVAGYLDILEDSWYSVPEDTMDSFLGQFSEGETYAKILSAPGIASRLGEILRSHDLFEFKKDLGDNKVGEAETYHYQVKLDSTEAFDLVLEFVREVARAQGEEKSQGFEEELKTKAEKVKKVGELLDFVLREVNVELWIGKGDNLLYRLKADGSFDGKFLSSYVEKKNALDGETGGKSDEATGEESLDFSLDYTLSDFNTAAVRKPENAKDLDKALVVLEYQGMKEKSQNDPDQDGDGLSDKLEALYGSDARKTDTDGDGHPDGDEVWNGYDPIAPGNTRADYGKIYDSLVESLR